MHDPERDLLRPPDQPRDLTPPGNFAPWSPFMYPVSLGGCFTLALVAVVIALIVLVVRVV